MTQSDTLSSRLDALEKLAKAATPGRWVQPDWIKAKDRGVVVALCKGVPVNHVAQASPQNERSQRIANAAYIAAANPSAILALIGEVRTLLEKSNG